MKKVMIEFKDFSFQYRAQQEPTLQGINLTIVEGEKVLIVGPSGSGKSTLAHCINGLIPFAYSGEISGSLRIMGQEQKDLSIAELSNQVGTVLQDPDGQFVGLTVGEDIAFSLENHVVQQTEMKSKVAAAARAVDIHEFLASSPQELSGGQKQKTTLAGVLVGDVDILLFDEPLASLDPYTGIKAIELIDRVHKETGKTVIMIEHRLEEVLHRAVDRIIVIHEGCIVADMPAAELLSTTLLSEVGIREPLYLTALKYAGCSITANMNPQHMNDIQLEACSNKLKIWYECNQARQDKLDSPPILELSDISFGYEKISRC